MKSEKVKTFSGVHIQYPWSQLLLSGEKTVETRKYPLPKKFEDVSLAIIETAGKSKPTFKARIVGIITFSNSIEYKNFEDWKLDEKRHSVSVDNPIFAYKENVRKYGWVVKSVTKLKEPCLPPKKRGIVFALNCEIKATLL